MEFWMGWTCGVLFYMIAMFFLVKIKDGSK